MNMPARRADCFYCGETRLEYPAEPLLRGYRFESTPTPRDGCPNLTDVALPKEVVVAMSGRNEAVAEGRDV